jgi:hypothetical protein
MLCRALQMKAVPQRCEQAGSVYTIVAVLEIKKEIPDD